MFFRMHYISNFTPGCTEEMGSVRSEGMGCNFVAAVLTIAAGEHSQCNGV